MIRTRGGFAALLLAASALATPLPVLKGAEFEVGLSPDKGSLDLVLETIRSARAEIFAAALPPLGTIFVPTASRL